MITFIFSENKDIMRDRYVEKEENMKQRSAFRLPMTLRRLMIDIPP